MAEEPIRDRARSDKGSSSYRMTSFLVLTSSKTQPVTEEELDREIGGLGPAPPSEEPGLEVEAVFSARAEGAIPPLQLLWQRTHAFYQVAVYLISYPFMLVHRRLQALAQGVRTLCKKVWNLLVLRPARHIQADLQALWLTLTGLKWRTARDTRSVAAEQAEDEVLEFQTAHPLVSFLELNEMNINFSDNHNRPIYDFGVSRHLRYSLSKAVVDPIACQNALAAVRECASRATAIPPPVEGRYAGIPVAEVLADVSEEDLQGFLQYVKAFPGNYIGRNLKMSETFATWVVYGAPEP